MLISLLLGVALRVRRAARWRHPDLPGEPVRYLAVISLGLDHLVHRDQLDREAAKALQEAVELALVEWFGVEPRLAVLRHQ